MSEGEHWSERSRTKSRMAVRDGTSGKLGNRGWKAETVSRKEYGSDKIQNEKELPLCWTS